MKIFGTDFDGVIINIEPKKAAAFAELVNKEWGIDKDAACACWHDFCGTSRRYKFDYFYKKEFGKKLDDEAYQLIESKYSSFLKANYYPKVKFLTGALELLKFAHENFDYTFVSSGMPMEEIKYLIKLLGLSQYFDLVLGTNNTYKSKSDHFRELLADKNPDLLVFVADGAKDMEIAKEFGAKSVGILSNRPRRELEEAGASAICETTLQAIPLIKSWL
jgi:phosphoglycolate phosphatase-like HAD superfamily hydrolase